MKNLTATILFILFLNTLAVNPTFAQQSVSELLPEARYASALEQYYMKKYAVALEGFESYLSDPHSEMMEANAYYYAAMCAMHIFHEDTEERFLFFLKKYHWHAKANQVHYQIGRYYFTTKDYAKTATALDEANPRDMNEADRQEYYFMLGYAAYQEEDMEKAIQNFGRNVKGVADLHTPSVYYYAYLHYLQKDYETAQEYFLLIKEDKEFIKIVPVYLVKLYLLNKDFEKAISYGEELLERPGVGKKQEITAYLGEAAYQLKKYDQVVQYIGGMNVQKLTPEQNYQLGYAYFEQEMFKEAIASFNMVNISEDSVGQNVAFHLGGAYLAIDEKEKAKNSFSFAAKNSFDPYIAEEALIQNAKLAFELNYQKEALNSLQAFVKSYPRSSHINEANSLLSDILLSTQNYKTAIEIIDGLPRKNVDIKKAYQKITYHYAVERFKDRAYEEARNYLNVSLQNIYDNKYRNLAYFWLGESQYQLKNYTEAVKQYRNFLYMTEAKTSPYYALGYYNVGYGLMKVEDYQEARIYFSRFLELKDENNQLDEDYHDALTRMADCHLALRNYAAAKENFEKVIQLKAKETDYAYYQLGMIHGIQGDFDKKRNALNNVVQNFPASHYMDDALFELADMDFVNGDFKSAANQFEYLVQEYSKSPYYRVARLKLGLIAYNQDKNKKALEILKDLIQVYPHSSEAKEALNTVRNIYIDQGRGDDLFAFLKSVDANFSASYEDSVTYAAAFTNVQKNDCEKAINSLSEYLSRFENGYFKVNAHYYLAQCLNAEGRKEDAIEHYEAVIQRSPNTFMEVALKQAGNFYEEKGDNEAALEAFVQLSEVSISKANVVYGMRGQMRNDYALGQYKHLIRVGEELLKLSYTDENDRFFTLSYLGKAYFAQKNYNKAISYFEPLMEEASNEKGALANYYLAHIYVEKEDYETAQDLIFNMRQRFPGQDEYIARAFILLADIFVQKEDYFQAKHTLQSIIDNYDGEEVLEEAKLKLEYVKSVEPEGSSLKSN